MANTLAPHLMCVEAAKQTPLGQRGATSEQTASAALARQAQMTLAPSVYSRRPEVASAVDVFITAFQRMWSIRTAQTDIFNGTDAGGTCAACAHYTYSLFRFNLVFPSLAQSARTSIWTGRSGITNAVCLRVTGR